APGGFQARQSLYEITLTPADSRPRLAWPNTEHRRLTTNHSFALPPQKRDTAGFGMVLTPYWSTPDEIL
ncbi:MAG: hypothetical protein ACKPJD_06685, partial [Planctomycetaceae bacterium]